MSPTACDADFLEWDVRNWSAALEFWRAHSRQSFSESSALEVGSRNGGLSLWLALQGARVLCSDLGPANQNAIRQHQAHSVSHLIQYRSIDVTDIPYKDEFDIVLFKSVLGMVGTPDSKERQARAIAEIHRALKKGGELFFAENLRASPLHQCFRRSFVQWGTQWRYVSVGEMEEFLFPFSHVQCRTLGFAGAFGRGERQRNLLAILDERILNHIVPEDWRYIIVGVATK